jgi:hypothetical protein
MDKKDLSITQLLVNHENPRFEPVENESEAIDLMMTEAGSEVLNLAKDIAYHGLNPSKRLMVIEQGKGKFLPLEGNRRIVALKLLHRPDLAKDQQYKQKFEQLKREAGKEIQTTVECVVFPDRESAYRWVNLEHTGKNNGVGVLGWDSAQRQRFIAQFAGKKLSRAIQLIDFAKDNKIASDSVDSTTLDRLLGNPAVREYLGLDFKDGSLEPASPKSVVLANVQKLFAAMSAREFKVAQVYTSMQAKAWVAAILGIKQPTAKPQRKAKANKPSTKPDPFDGDWITPQLLGIYPHKNRVKAILQELKGLSPSQKPNVCATSLRVLLELAVYVFLDQHGGIKKIIEEKKAELTKDNARRVVPKVMEKDWAPSFQLTLSYLCNDESLMPDPLARKAIKTFIGKKSSEPFLLELNQFIHNPDYEPRSEAVIEIWNKLGKRIFRTVLSKPA